MVGHSVAAAWKALLLSNLSKTELPTAVQIDLTGRSTRPGTFFLLISLDSSLPQYRDLQAGGLLGELE